MLTAATGLPLGPEAAESIAKCCPSERRTKRCLQPCILAVADSGDSVMELSRLYWAMPLHLLI